MKPPFNLEAVEAATVIAMQVGYRLLHTHRFSEDDDEQVNYMLRVLAPKYGAMVLDAGCGIGEVSRLISETRPDLSFVLLNISPYQLSLCPIGEQFLHVLGDCHSMPIENETLDAVLFSSTLCQLDASVALGEAFRVLKPGGVLLISDMVRDGGDAIAMEAILAARVLSNECLTREVEDAGFTVEKNYIPKFNDIKFRELLSRDKLDGLLDGIHPIIIRAIKGDEL